ncbi:hypothetical protein Tco_0162966 [Tanacetum coccineum]
MAYAAQSMNLGRNPLHIADQDSYKQLRRDLKENRPPKDRSHGISKKKEFISQKAKADVGEKREVLSIEAFNASRCLQSLSLRQMSMERIKYK